MENGLYMSCWREIDENTDKKVTRYIQNSRQFDLFLPIECCNIIYNQTRIDLKHIGDE